MRLDVLGPVLLEGDDHAAVAVPGRKARQMLTVLALTCPEQISIERLVDTLWADPPRSATKTVQAHLSRLRSVLAAAGAAGSLQGGPDGYRLELGDRLDTTRLRVLTRRARAARDGGDPLTAVELFGRARQLWRGEPELPDTLRGESIRRRLDDERLEVAISHLGASIDAGAAERAVAELGELVTAEPLNERVWELRIVALYRSGRRTEALRAVRHVARLLGDEVGVEPGPALRELEAAILADDAVSTPAAPPPPRTIPATDISYTDAGGVKIAYRTFGDGPDPVLLLNPGLISIDTLLDETHIRRAINRLAEGRNIVALDGRGVGLSDRTQDPGSITVDDWVADIDAVLDALELDTVDVFAGGHGGLTAIRLAETRSHRVRSLTLMNAFARFTRADDYPHGVDPATFALMQAGIQSIDPAPGVDVLTLVSPSTAADPTYRRWWNDAGRRAASPTAASAIVERLAATDVRSSLSAIHAPTLVIIRRGCLFYDAAHGEFLARAIARTTVERHDDVNDPWWVGDTNVIVAAFERHLSSLRPRP